MFLLLRLNIFRRSGGRLGVKKEGLRAGIVQSPV